MKKEREIQTLFCPFSRIINPLTNIDRYIIMKTYNNPFFTITTRTRSPSGPRFVSIVLPTGQVIRGHLACLNFLHHFYSQSGVSDNKPISTVGETNTSIVDPNYISGLTQADGSFFCTISKNAKSKFGIRIRPTFSITQDLNSVSVLESIMKQFKCGYITINNNTHSAEYTVNSLTDLVHIIIPHFSTYKLHSAKQYSFLMMVKIIHILIDKKHYESQVLASVIKMAYSMNKVTNRTIEQEKALFEFLGIAYVEDCLVEPELINPPLNPAFLAGLIDGDGSFFVTFLAGGRVKVGFHITQHIALQDLLENVLMFFGCGTIQKDESGVIRYLINKFEDIHRARGPQRGA